MRKLQKPIFRLGLICLYLCLVVGCSRSVTYSQKGWSLIVDAARQNLSITQSDLGAILNNVQLQLNKNGTLVALSGWAATKTDNRMLTITTTTPEATTWWFIVTEEGLDINASIDNAVVTGVAPASGARIPARQKSQDNGVIYTSLGYVSAKNIYCLFDRMTDTLIQFPKETSLIRDTANEELMDVMLPLLPRRSSREGRGRDQRGIKTTQSIEIVLTHDYYTKELGLKHYVPYWPQHPKRRPFDTAPTGWLSWYCYYMPANEEDMVKETDALSDELKQYGLQYVQLDATFTNGEGASWLEWNKTKFPKGGKWLMQYIKSKGLKPGLWVNVYGADYTKPDFGTGFPGGKYPENWYLHDKDGKHLPACCTGDNSDSNLDYSNPEVIEKHLKPLFRTLVNDWGIEYLKDAGHARWIWNYEENRQRVFNPSLEGRDLYWQVQDAVREIMGPERWLMGCDAEGGGDYYSLGFGRFDSTFDILNDVYNVWESRRFNSATGTKMHLATLFSANYLNDIVLYNDPDATMVRPPLTMEEAINNVTSMSLTGQAYIISDFMSQPSDERVQELTKRMRWGRDFPQLIKKLSTDRVELYRRTMPSVNITPIDLYPFKSKAEYAPLPDGYPEITNFPRALDLKVNAKSGVYDVVALYNWADESTEKEISFADLGLDTAAQYLVFDFWNQEFLGLFKDSVKSTVPAHGANTLIVRPVLDQPQFLAMSRHITCSYGIEDLSWNPTDLSMKGVSDTVPGAQYSVFVHVPKSMSVSGLQANAANVSHIVKPNEILEIHMDGQQAPVSWTISFKKEAL